MKNNFFIKLLSFITVAALFLVLPVQAQGPIQQDGILMVCLHAKQGDCFKDNGNNCSGGPMGPHTTEVTGSGFQPGKPIEIWRKVDGKMKCAIDSANPVQSTCSQGPTIGTEFQVLTSTKDQITANLNRELITDTNGDKMSDGAVIIRSVTEENKIHTFYGIQIIEGGPIDVAETALKLSTFVPPSDALNSCVSVKWDPFGTVFDAISLEPIAGTSVSLYKNSLAANAIVPIGPGVPKNPFIVGPDGIFSFIVEDGDYYLSPKKTGYSFPVSSSKTTELKTGGQDFYVNQNPVDAQGVIDQDWLYTGTVIRQRGIIKHRDIPLMPPDINNPTNVQPTILDLNITQFCVGSSCYQLVNGSCSHPKCTVSAYNAGVPLVDPLTGGAFRARVNAQRYFEFAINNKAITDPSQSIEFIGEKFSAAGVTPAASAKSTSAKVGINPVPAYLEGYVYDKKLAVAPNSIVKLVIPEMNNRVAMTVLADKDGYINISHSLVPPHQYDIQVLDSSGKVLDQIKSSKFITLNKSYFNNNGIDLMNPPDVNESTDAASLDTRPTSIPFFRTGTGLSDLNVTPTTVPASESPTNNVFIVIVTLLFVLVLGGLGVMLLRMRNQNKSPLA